MGFESGDAMAKAFENPSFDKRKEKEEKLSNKRIFPEDESYDEYWKMAEVENNIHDLRKEIREIELSMDLKKVPDESKLGSIEKKEDEIKEHKKKLKELEEESFKKGSSIYRFWLRLWLEVRGNDYGSVLDGIKKGFHYGDLFNSLAEAKKAGFVKTLSKDEVKDIKDKLKKLGEGSKEDGKLETEKIKLERNLLFLKDKCFTRVDFNSLYYIESQKPPEVKKEKNEAEKKEIEKRKTIFKELKELRKRARDERKDFQLQNEKLVNKRDDFLSFWRNQKEKSSKNVKWIEKSGKNNEKEMEAELKFRKNKAGGLMVDWAYKNGKKITFPYGNPPHPISRIIEKKLRKGVLERGGFLVDNKFPKRGSLVVNERGRINLASKEKYEGIYFPGNKKEEERFIERMPELKEALFAWRRTERKKRPKVS